MKYALCAGINDYPGDDADLSGCVNDVYDWAEVLRGRGFETTTLVDGEVTLANLTAQLQSLVDKARYRDSIVFQYSGHGTWTPDQDGDEADARDEALVCFDYDNGGLLTDDIMHDIFRFLKRGVRALILSDSCHSGTVNKFFAPSVDGKPRFLSPAKIATVPVDETTAAEMEERILLTPSRAGALLISGCNDPEYSYDANFGGRPNGAFTRAAIDTLPSATTYRDWYSRIRQILPNGSHPQSPQLQGTSYQRGLRAVV